MLYRKPRRDLGIQDKTSGLILRKLCGDIMFIARYQAAIPATRAGTKTIDLPFISL